MKINRITTRAYLISKDAERKVVDYFHGKARALQGKSASKVSLEMQRKYAPVLVFSAIKRDSENPNKLIYGLENRFHINLSDGSIYVFSKESKRESATGFLFKDPVPRIEKISLLLQLVDLTPKALQTLGYIIDQGTLNVNLLDAPTQKAVRELEGRKYVDVYRPEERESILASIFKEVMEFKRVTPVSYVKPFLHIPKFPSALYNISPRLRTTDVLEDDYVKEKIIHSPEKLGILLGTLLNCSLILEEIVYLPYVRCEYAVSGQHLSEERYIACLKNAGDPLKYSSPVKVRTIMLGTKGHGIESVPIEDVSINFSNVAGMEELKKKIRESIILPLLNPKLAKEYGSKVGGGILMYGPPGCGKTYIMRATVGEAG
ncbi:MAG: hypothetical protein NTU61_01265, partial [Candidatus Altiarchaeota archaeon]|nr:hypothetical protein [Candidatus Altiarchaeota archaeon]